MPKPVIPLVLEFGLVMVPAPDNKLQVPVPTEVVFAAIVAVVAQTDCETPAAAGVGGALRVIDIVEVLTAQTPLDVCH